MGRTLTDSHSQIQGRISLKCGFFLCTWCLFDSFHAGHRFLGRQPRRISGRPGQNSFHIRRNAALKESDQMHSSGCLRV